MSEIAKWDDGVTPADEDAGFGVYHDGFAAGASWGQAEILRDLQDTYEKQDAEVRAVVDAAFNLMGMGDWWKDRQVSAFVECEPFASWCAYHGNGEGVEPFYAHVAEQTTRRFKAE